LPRASFPASRNTHASTLIHAGVDALTISRRLDQSSASLTLDIYGHLMEGTDAAAVKSY
jgi:integrase